MNIDATRHLAADAYLFPPVEPAASGRLAVDGRHSLYWEECGNRDGPVVVFLHGGPGGGCLPHHRRFFDPAYWRIVLYDQRGAGRSSPNASVVDNTTWTLVADLEKLRGSLGAEKMVLFGGSWGSTLALAYAQTHPARCAGLVLRGIFLATERAIDWFMHGMGRIFPEARAAFEAQSEEAFPPGTQRYALPLLYVAAAVEADARGLPVMEPGRPAVLARIRSHLRRLPTLVPVWAAHGLLIEAELARAEGTDSPEDWARAAAAFTPLQRPYELAQVRHRWAEAILAASGDRGAAAVLLREAHAVAERLGARPLAESVELLAGRARIPLALAGAGSGGSRGAVDPAGEEDAPDPGPAVDAIESFGLTAREREVHRLVAAGYTNRRIAEELYISPKTASVHVSNILAKLGVSSRGEAAALAHRFRLYAVG
jgi:pimeloyl-ACP methyl ester carboxylesterase